jgi:UDPglucose 6-dehydrogenase
VRQLLDAGATVAVYDPVAMDEAKRVLALDLSPAELARVRFADSAMNTLDGATALVIVTEWKAFRSPDFDQIKAALKHAVIFDGRNLFEPQVMAEAGVEYHGIGRSILTRS